MGYRVVIEGNKFYEIDEECLKRFQNEKEIAKDFKDQDEEYKKALNADDDRA